MKSIEFELALVDEKFTIVGGADNRYREVPDIPCLGWDTNQYAVPSDSCNQGTEDVCYNFADWTDQSPG